MLIKTIENAIKLAKANGYEIKSINLTDEDFEEIKKESSIELKDVFGYPIKTGAEYTHFIFFN